MKKARVARGSGGIPPGKILKSRPPKMHFQHFGSKIRLFEQNTDIIKFWLFYLVTSHECCI